MHSVSSPSEQLLEASAPAHIVQLYQADERVLTKNVTGYLWEGLKQGDGLLVIATEEHTEAFTRQLMGLGADPWTAVRKRGLVFLDAEETLARFMMDGQPDWQLFESTIRAAMETVDRRTQNAGLRAYGEMVGILWQAEQYSAAIQLEEFWNDLLKSGGFQLFCAYPIDVFGHEFHSSHVDALLCAHTHLVSAGESSDVGTALNRAMDQVLGPKKFDALGILNGHNQPAWAAMPQGEAAILSLRAQHPDRADEVLARARQHYHSEKRFRALVENSSDAICVLDSQGSVLYASASTQRVLGYAPEELVGRNAFEMIHPDDAERAATTLLEVVAKPRSPVTIEARMPRHNGSWRWVESTISNLLDEASVGALVLNCRDISERKAADEEKQRVREDLARSNAELQAFAYAATHDLQEPLRTVCAFTELLVKTTPMDGNAKEFAGFIVEGVKRMSSLLDDLLSFTRLSLDDPQHRVELSRAAEQAIRNLAGAIRDSAATITVDRLPAIRGNESHLIELFQNLIANAIKYRSERPIEIHITAEQLGQECIVRVKDNGIGIAPEYRDYVFGLFKRLHDRDIPGTGIGLAICKKILEGMGGRIWVESELGKGSTFCFSAAAAEALAAAPENVYVSRTASWLHER
jgi:PAS domain S-box-containing protein